MDKNELTKKRQELKKILFEENDNKVYKEINRKEKQKKPVFTNIILSLMLVITLAFSGFLIIDSVNRINETYEIINALMLILIVISFIISFKKNRKKKTGSTIFTSLLIIITMLFNGLYLTSIIKLPTQKYIPNFYNKNLSEVIKWTESNNITHNETFEYSDNIKKYNVISQTKKAKTLLKNIKNVDFVISNGPDYNKEVIIPDMTGWTTDEVLKFVDKNYLKNVGIAFEENKEIKNDTIIRQSATGKVKRSDSIIFTASLGDINNLSPIKLKELKNKKLLNAVTYLGKNGIIYELKYEFSNDIERGKIIKTEPKKGTTINPNDKVILTVSKGKEIKVPDLKNKTLSEVTKWIIENNLDIEYQDKYDNDIKKGLVISSNYQTGDIIEEETKINIIFSKGKLVMPKFNDLASFKTWASTYNIKYEIKEEFNKDIPKDNIIKFSVNENEKINTEEPLIVYVSKGEAIITPDFIGKTKNEITKECNNLEIMCAFSLTKSNKKEGTAISQSIQKGTEIAKGQVISIEIATQKQINIPSKKTNTSASQNSNQTNNNQTNTNTNTNQNNNGCNGETYTVKGLNTVFNECSSFTDCKTKVQNYFKNNYKGVNINVKDDGGSSGLSSGSYVSGTGNGSKVECGKTYSITLAK